jgi:hypothetical protein
MKQKYRAVEQKRNKASAMEQIEYKSAKNIGIVEQKRNKASANKKIEFKHETKI